MASLARRGRVLAVAGGIFGAIMEPAAWAGPAMREAIREGLPKYDPKVRAASVVAGESAAAVVPDAALAYGVKDRSAEAPAGTSPPGTPESALMLPRIVVRPVDNTAKPEPVTLPRLVVRPPIGQDEKADDFEAPAARQARLVKKHLSAFDRFFLNRFTLPLFGISKQRRAQQAEAIERDAKRLNEMAELLDLSKSERGETAEDRELRELYLELYNARAK